MQNRIKYGVLMLGFLGFFLYYIYTQSTVNNSTELEPNKGQQIRVCPVCPIEDSTYLEPPKGEGSYVESMTFREAWGGGNALEANWISAQGEITKSTPETFRKFLSQLSNDPLYIVIDSRGGEVEAAIELGRLIRNAGLDSFIGKTLQGIEDIEDWETEYDYITTGVCLGASAYAFLGGVDRYIDDPNQLGFQNLNELKVTLVEYLMDMGISPRILRVIEASNAGEFVFFKDEEINLWNIVNQKKYTHLKVLPIGNRLGIYSINQGSAYYYDMDEKILFVPYEDKDYTLVLIDSDDSRPWPSLDIENSEQLVCNPNGYRIYFDDNSVEFGKDDCLSFISNLEIATNPYNAVADPMSFDTDKPYVAILVPNSELMNILKADSFTIMLLTPRVAGGWQVYLELNEDDRELFRLVLLDEQIETGYDKAPKLTLEDIYERFPMCGWRNSRGQMCKTLSEDEYLTPKDLGTAEYTDNVLTVESEDWYYVFELIDEDELSVIFTDDAKFGTYLTKETLHIRWDQDLKDWIIEGSTLNYLSGSDQDGIGKKHSLFIPFSERIELVSKSTNDSSKELEYHILVEPVINAFKNNNRNEIAKMISYPLFRRPPLPCIENENELLSRFDEVFDNELTSMILDNQFEQLDNGSIMLLAGSGGDTWFPMKIGIRERKIVSISYESKLEENKRKELIEISKKSLNENVNFFVRPVANFETENYHIRIDDMGGKEFSYRYTVWNLPKTVSDEPDLVLLKGELVFGGSAHYSIHYFKFQNGDIEYRVNFYDHYGDISSETLTVYNGSEEILNEDIVKWYY